MEPEENTPTVAETTEQPENTGDTGAPEVVQTPEQVEAAKVAAEEAEVKPHIEHPGVKKRIDELTAKQRTEREARIAADLENESLKKQLEAARTQTEKGPEYPPEPNPDDFIGRDTDYRTAMREWGLKLAGVRAEYDRNVAEESKHAQTLTQKRAAAMTKYDDFREVAENPQVAAIVVKAPAMNEAIANCENMGDIMYFLGKNPAEAARIAGLNPYQQVMEVGRLEDKIKAAPPVKTVSKAPDPVKTVGGGGDTKVPDWTDPKLTTDERIALFQSK